MTNLAGDRLALRVRELRWEAEHVVSIGLENSTGNPLPTWEPGAHIDLEMPNGIERQYSLCSDPEEPLWRVAVLREEAGRGSSAFVHDSLRPGDILQASMPRNNFAFDDAEQYVFIAGGIGITPMINLAEKARASGAAVRFAYLGRSRQRMAFLAHTALRGAEVIAADEGSRLDLAAWIGDVTPNTAVYACGPERLLDALEELAQAWPKGALHLERFHARALPQSDSTSFEVECRQSGMTVTVPDDASVLEVLERAGLQIMSSCREGVCGTCEVPILEGIAEHRDSLLSPDERESQSSMMVCVSRAACPRLVLDI